MIESRGVVQALKSFALGACCAALPLVYALVLTCAGDARAQGRPATLVPSQLQEIGHLIEDAEVELMREGVTVGAPAPRGEPRPVAIQHFVADEVDPTRGAATRARAERLARAADGRGNLCFYAIGLRVLALSLQHVAEVLGRELTARALAMAAESLRIAIDHDWCDGSGGDQAHKEWDAIGAAGGRKMSEHLHRAPCQPVPAPGVVACAPTRDEVRVPQSPAEWMLLCAGLAAGMLGPEVAAAFPGVTWAEVFAAASAAAPAVVRVAP